MRSALQKNASNNRCIKMYHKITAYIKQFGHPPSLRDLCVLMDMNSTSHVAKYLRILEDWKWIEMDAHKCRTMRLIRPTEIEVPHDIRAIASRVSDRIGGIEGNSP